MRHAYMLIECESSEALGEAVMLALADGWDLWGNPIVQDGYYDGLSRSVHYCQAIVRQVDTPAGKPADSKEEIASGEVRPRNDTEAGYTVLLPEKRGATTMTVPCACFEMLGDNPECQMHGQMLVTRAIPLLRIFPPSGRLV
jgi:hypothetical protein